MFARPTRQWVVVDQVRPATNQTMYVTDYIGTWAQQGAVVLSQAADENTVIEADLDTPDDAARTRLMAIPVTRNGRVIAILSKEWEVRSGRSLGELERAYKEIFDKFVVMIQTGTFPFAGRVADSSAAPRVGDGVLSLDATAR